MDNKTNSYKSTFECPLCLATHRTLKDSEFPVSETVMKLLAKLPAEVYRAKSTSHRRSRQYSLTLSKPFVRPIQFFNSRLNVLKN